MNNLVTEPVGFKFTLAGFFAWGYSVLQGVDLTQVIGFFTLIIGIVIQVVAYYRQRKADERAKEADKRDKIKYELEVELLQRQLAAHGKVVKTHGSDS